MNAVNLCYMPATELLDAYRSRRLSPVEVTRAVLERIDRLNPTINAFVTVTHERALADAFRAERAYAAGGDAPSEPMPPVGMRRRSPEFRIH